MKVEVRGATVCIVSESSDDNTLLQRVGADHDRAMVGVSVHRDPQLEGSDLEPLVVALSKLEDDLGDMVGNTV
jgi:hypothetical protein